MAETVADLYKLKDKKQALVDLERMGEKSAQNLIEQIEKEQRRHTAAPAACTRYSAGGRGHGTGAGQHFGSLDAVMDAG